MHLENQTKLLSLFKWYVLEFCDQARTRVREHQIYICQTILSGDEHADKIVDNVVFSMWQILTN